MRSVQPQLLPSLLLTAGLCFAGVAHAQSEEPIILGESVDVYLVNVEVRVTTKDGEPVSGLTRADFTLKENGKKVDISNFIEIPPRPGEAIEAQSSTNLDDTGEPTASEPAATVIYVIDESSTTLADRRIAFDQLMRLLEGKLGQGRGKKIHTAIAVYDNSLKIVAQPTTQQQVLLDAVADVADTKASGLRRRIEQDRLLAEVAARTGEIREEARGDLIPVEEAVRKLNQLNREVQMEADRRRDQNRDRFAALGSLIDALAQRPGRKALVMLTDGITLQPGQAALDIVQDALWEVSTLRGTAASGASIDARSAALGALSDQGAPPPRRRRAKKAKADDLMAVAALAANAGVSFYPWKPRVGLGQADASFLGPAALELSPGILNERESSLVDGIKILADETGGKAVVGGKLEGLVQDAIDDFTGYYSLGFSPKHGADDQIHKLKVRVKRRGVEVWHPKSYVARSLP